MTGSSDWRQRVLSGCVAHSQPMRCLCGAKSCRGYIGGTGEAVTADEDMEDPEDASEDPEPIMINSAEAADPTLVAVLESEVGLAPEYWDSAVWRRCVLLSITA